MKSYFCGKSKHLCGTYSCVAGDISTQKHDYLFSAVCTLQISFACESYDHLLVFSWFCPWCVLTKLVNESTMKTRVFLILEGDTCIISWAFDLGVELLARVSIVDIAPTCSLDLRCTHLFWRNFTVELLNKQMEAQFQMKWTKLHQESEKNGSSMERRRGCCRTCINWQFLHYRGPEYRARYFWLCDYIFQEVSLCRRRLM